MSLILLLSLTASSVSDKAGIERRYARFAVAQTRLDLWALCVSETVEEDEGKNSSHGDGYDSKYLSLTCWLWLGQMSGVNDIAAVATGRLRGLGEGKNYPQAASR